MDEKIAYWASVVFGALALMLLVTNMSMINGNRQLQEEVSQRQATINGGVTQNQINNGLVQALAEIAVKNSDTEARDLLAAQGITLTAPAKQDEPKETGKATKETKKKSEKSEQSEQ